MHTTDKGKALIIWLSGARLQDIRALPAVEEVLKCGANLALEASPMIDAHNQYYQATSGRSPATFGFFDSLVVKNYAVVEESSGRGTTPKLLPDLLRTGGWMVQYEEKPLSALNATIRSWAQSATDPRSCLIVRCVVHANEISAGLTSLLPMAVRSAQEAVGESGLLALLSETQSASVKRFVNVNNFLAEMGVIERDEQSGTVNWFNSLAYFAGHGQLWVNLQGREPQGAAHPQEDYEEIRDTLVKALPTKLRDSGSGAPVIERVYRKEELYQGDYLFCAPDLVVEFTPGYAPSPKSTLLHFDEEVFTTPVSGTTALAGVHRSQATGFLLAAAPSLATNVSLSEVAPLTAVVPTLLHALGIEYVDMESQAISTLFSPAYLELHPIRSSVQSQELSEEDEELIINRLRDLGYV